ncbi:hypothetical protein LINGRAHAP2_LOCUS31343 [Linum grandiflorum]
MLRPIPHLAAVPVRHSTPARRRQPRRHPPPCPSFTLLPIPCPSPTLSPPSLDPHKPPPPPPLSYTAPPPLASPPHLNHSPAACPFNISDPLFQKGFAITTRALAAHGVLDLLADRVGKGPAVVENEGADFPPETVETLAVDLGHL